MEEEKQLCLFCFCDTPMFVQILRLDLVELEKQEARWHNLEEHRDICMQTFKAASKQSAISLSNLNFLFVLFIFFDRINDSLLFEAQTDKQNKVSPDKHEVCLVHCLKQTYCNASLCTKPGKLNRVCLCACECLEKK